LPRTETTPTFNFNWPGKSVIDDKVANSSVASWSFPAVCWLKNLFHQDLNCAERLTTTAFFLSGQTPATGATAIARLERTAIRLFQEFSAFRACHPR
jgi:hypothetical protein